jgi:tRNA threonylcarbamoyladenosine biosynthesis protein TsaB
MLLAVDTSTRYIGLALYEATSVISEHIWQTSNHHTIELAGAVKKMLDDNRVSPGMLKALAVATGPGSFTSLRIGLAFIKGMALTLSIPMIGIPSLDILAATIPTGDHPLFLVLQAGRGRLAVVKYRAGPGGWEPVTRPEICDLDGLFVMLKGRAMVAGELDSDQRHALSDRRKPIQLASPAACLRRPSHLAELAWKKYEDGVRDDPLRLAPIYVHIAEALPD